MIKSKLDSFILLMFLFLGSFSCKTNTHYFRNNYNNANSLIHQTVNLQTKPFLKAHLKNGDVVILKDSWQVDTISNKVTGSGIKYNFNRYKVFEGPVSIIIDSVSVFETNSKLQDPESDRIRSLSVLAGIDVVLGVICLTVPKSCFGSCPTFYINENDNFHYADAEGFSNAISPSLEYYDIDALNNQKLTSDQFSITMKNEALETHCVNDVKLLAYPRKENERIYQTPKNDFYLCSSNFPLSLATANEGDITSLLKTQDRTERFSLSDEKNMSSKEEVFLNFDDVNTTNDLGLLLDFRQTMMTTYFIYSALGYMGDEVGDIFALIEQNKQTANKLEGGLKNELGDIDIYLWNEEKNLWEIQSGFYETGPIAINKQFIPLKKSSTNSTIKLKLVMNKGLWRIDYVALTAIKDKVKPIEISPSSVLNKGRQDAVALHNINNPTKHLISMPGSHYTFEFTLPTPGTDYELFLYSKGYYLEWIRSHWLKDKNLIKLNQLVNNPKKYLQVEAKNYKRYETSMEQEFWNSKIDTKTFSYYDN